MNRYAAVNFRRIKTQTTFRLPQATAASLTKPSATDAREGKKDGCNPIRPQLTFEPNATSPDN
jgi:hypothetical protein